MRSIIPLVMIAITVGVSVVHADEIRLRANATVSGPTVHLGDIADLRTDSPSRTETLRQMIVRPTPAITTHIDYRTVRNLLRQRGVDVNHLRWTGASRTRVVPKLSETDASPEASSAPNGERQKLKGLQQAITARLAQQISGRDPSRRKFAVELLTPSSRLRTVEVRNVDTLLLAPQATPRIGRQTLRVMVAGAENRLHTISLDCDVQLLIRTLIVNRDMRRGERISGTDIGWGHVAGTHSRSIEPADVIGQTTTVPLEAGASLSANNVRLATLIRSGDVVTAYFRSPGLTIRRQYRARSSGAKDDSILLQDLKGQDRLTGRVIGAGVVAVETATVPVPSVQFLPTNGKGRTR